uniref:Uncharacterized protein n=1 Tax=Arundo donax TaxID=35708 RepID=A0A0A9GCX8_ARUDO
MKLNKHKHENTLETKLSYPDTKPYKIAGSINMIQIKSQANQQIHHKMRVHNMLRSNQKDKSNKNHQKLKQTTMN